MDPKRKKIYIIVIIICVVLSAGILLWSRGGSAPAVEPSSPVVSTSDANSGVAAKTPGSNNYSVPASFPANPKLDTSVLESSVFKSLSSYQPTTIQTGDLGRDDPFKTY